MTKKILHLHLGHDAATDSSISLLGQHFAVHSLGTGGDIEQIVGLIHEGDADPTIDAIALDGPCMVLELGHRLIRHVYADRLAQASQKTPLVSGREVRGAFERWAIRLLNDAEPGIFTRKHVLLAPGLNHKGLAEGLAAYTENRRWAEPVFYYNLPSATTSERAMDRLAYRILEVTHDKPFRRIFPQPGKPGVSRSTAPFEWAHIIAGDVGAIRRYAPDQLPGKTIITEAAGPADIADLRRRGVETLITTMPPLTESDMDSSRPARWPAAVVEACMAAHLGKAELKESDYLNLLAELEWQPAMVNLQRAEKINRFAFVIHPLGLSYIYRHPLFRLLKWLPGDMVERLVAWLPPFYLSHITNIESPTGQKVEGYLYTLTATPREIMRRDPEFTYKRIKQIAEDAEERGARLLGLGAFTSVVGDAGITVARDCDIAITSGNSLTVAATLETAKQAVIKLGVTDLTHGRAMVIGATGSIGSVCSRLLAQAIYDVTLVAPRPEKLIALKRTIAAETPGAKVTIATTPDEYVGEMDVIVTTTTAFNQRIIDVTRCKPGAVICDVARPPDIEEWEAALRPDVLVIESGEILLPGDPDFGYDIGLPPKTAYACLAETALLAMEGRFEDYSVGRELEVEKVKEIYRLFKKHHLKLAGMRSFDQYITEKDLQRRRQLADEFRADPEWFRRFQEEARRKLEEGDQDSAQGDGDSKRRQTSGLGQWAPIGIAAALVAGGLVLLDNKRLHSRPAQGSPDGRAEPTDEPIPWTQR